MREINLEPKIQNQITVQRPVTPDLRIPNPGKVQDVMALIVTYRCNAKCRSCSNMSGPRRKERMPLDEMLNYIDQGADTGTITTVTFTGGEPFLLYEDLLVATRHARGRGLQTRCLTNGFWGAEPNALEIAQRFQEAGLDMLVISYDDYHAEFVEPGAIREAYRAARQAGLPVLFYVVYERGSRITIENLPEVIGLEPGELNIQGRTLVPVGRSAGKVSEDELAYVDDYFEKSYEGPCPFVLHQPSFKPDGQVQACCGVTNEMSNRLIIGQAREEHLITLLKRGQDDALLTWLELEGPHQVLKFAREHNPELKLPRRYSNICHACRYVYNPEVQAVLSDHIQEKLPALALKRLLTQG